MSTDGDRFVILYEYMRNHSLRYQLDTKAHLSMQTRVYILLDAARGLQYLHDNKPPLIHRNIKSSNILLDNSFRARLSDFGMAIHANKRSSDTDISGYTHYITTEHNSVVQRNRGYCAKEVASGKYHVKSDTYAFGVVIYEMCTAQLAYDSSRPMRDLELVDFMENNTNNRDNALALQDKSTKWAPAVYVKLLEIAGRCTKDNKRNRPDMKEVYQDLDQLRLEMNNLVDEAESEGQPDDDPNQAEYANMEQLGAQAHRQYPDPQLVYQAALTADQMRYHAGYNRQGVTEQMYLHPKAGDMSAMTETCGAPYSNHSFMSNMERNPIESSHRETSLTDSTLSSLNLSIGPQNQIPLLIPPDTAAPTPASLPSGAGDRPTPHVTHQPPQIQPYQENGIPQQTGEFLDPSSSPMDDLVTSIISPESMNGVRDSPDRGTDDSEESDSSSCMDDTEGFSSADTVLDLFSALNCTDAVDTTDSAADNEETTGGGVDEDYLKQLMSTLNISSSAAAINDPDNTSQNDRQQQHNSLPSMTNGESQHRLTNSVA